jgi:ParE toxin of type II toxin-antitoxin system, parDE
VIATAFLLEFQRVRDLLIENQQRGSRLEDGLRTYHFNRFPYSVIYEEDQTHRPQIFAVAHQSREPGYWIDRA